MTCTVGIAHVNRNDRVYANIMSVMQRRKSAPARMPCDGLTFSLSDEPFDEAGYARLPQWMQTVIAQSPEYQAAVASPEDTEAALKRILQPPPRVDDLDDDIPF
jgi:hypothetical protein